MQNSTFWNQVSKKKPSIGTHIPQESSAQKNLEGTTRCPQLEISSVGLTADYNKQYNKYIFTKHRPVSKNIHYLTEAAKPPWKECMCHNCIHMVHWLLLKANTYIQYGITLKPAYQSTFFCVWVLHSPPNKTNNGPYTLSWNMLFYLPCVFQWGCASRHLLPKMWTNVIKLKHNTIERLL